MSNDEIVRMISILRTISNEVKMDPIEITVIEGKISAVIVILEQMVL